jgi:hypothetical protein
MLRQGSKSSTPPQHALKIIAKTIAELGLSRESNTGPLAYSGNRPEARIIPLDHTATFDAVPDLPQYILHPYERAHRGILLPRVFKTS